MAQNPLRAQIIGLTLIAVLASCPNPAGDTPTHTDESETPAIVLTGYVIDALKQYTSGHWVDGTWQAFSGQADAIAYASLVYDGSVYVVGHTRTLGNYSEACIWKDGTRQALALPTNAFDSTARDVLVMNGRIVVSGYYSYKNGTSTDRNCGYWIDGIWNQATLPDGVTRCYAIGLAEMNGSVLLCGYASHGKSYIWTNGRPDELAIPVGYEGSRTRRLLVDNGDIYCSGYLLDSNYKYTPCVWKNGVPVVYGLPSGMTDGYIESIDIKTGSLVAVGDCSQTNDESETIAMIPGYWESGIWNALPLAPGTTQGTATAIIASENVITGYCIDSEGLCVSGYWKDGRWTALSMPTGAVESFVVDAASVQGSLTPTQGASSSRLVVLTGGMYPLNPAIMSANGKALVKDPLSNSAMGITRYGGDTYFCGSATVVTGGGGQPSYWKNGVRVGLNVPDGTWGTATDIAVVGTKVYATGNYSQHIANKPVDTPCVWIEGIRTDLPIGNAIEGQASRLVVVGSDVYVSGYLQVSPSNQGDEIIICYWKNGTRSDLASVTGLSSLTSFGVPVFGIATLGSDVYICGSSNDGPGKLIPTYWNVSGSSPVTTTLNAGAANKAHIAGIETVVGSIHAVGAYYDAIGGWIPAYWKDGVLSALETDNVEITKYQAGISIAIDGSDVYVVGLRSFGNIGEVPTLWKNGSIIPVASSEKIGFLLDVAVIRY